MFLPALAAWLVQGTPPADVAAAPATRLASDSAALAGALHGGRLDFALRGAGLTVHAEALPAESGCATRIATRIVDGSTVWTRLLRWADVAWTGALPDGRVTVAFYEREGRLPGDRLTFAPGDSAAFRQALQRVAETCRNAAAEDQRVPSGEYPRSRSCYFARLPELELIEPIGRASQGESSRAVLTILADETPEAELRLFLERRLDGNGWAEPEVAFTVAGPALPDRQIAAARFALDGAAVDAQHSLALYNHTRLRIRMDHFRAQAATEGDDSFYRRLAASDRTTLALIDTAGASRGAFNFEIGTKLTAARRALEAVAGSCGPSRPPISEPSWQSAE